MLSKKAASRYPLHPLIEKRWSPVIFDTREIEAEKIGSLLEAARWAPSCFNDQPTTFIVASTPESRTEFLKILVPQNREWAQHAPVLMLSVARLTFTHSGKSNRHALHDAGLAMENLTLQAVAMDLIAHQMAGFDPLLAREIYTIPEDHEPVTVVAVGYHGDDKNASEAQKQRDASLRSRKPLEEIAFVHKFGEHYY